jgi:hypothetical protein
LLGDVRGRIDHGAIDLKRRRLFVAEPGNDNVGIVDLSKCGPHHLRTERATRCGLRSLDRYALRSRRSDGSVRLLEGDDHKPMAQVDLGSDADNIRVDGKGARLRRPWRV